MNQAPQRLIVALDVSSAAAARKIVAAVGDCACYKVGLQLYTAEGPQLIRELVNSGRRVFLDLKYFDIPNTVAAAVTEAARLGISMLTVHAAGGATMLKAATEAASAVNPDLMVLGVTVLTSWKDGDLEPVGMQGRLEDQVLRLGALALANGCHGVVTSAREASLLRAKLGGKFAVITPGVRPEGSARGDQVRVVTPAEAMAAGATHIVVGRPILEAKDPGAQARDILLQMASPAVV
jgi:orotidine-5'-phosphate decarboxylase